MNTKEVLKIRIKNLMYEEKNRIKESLILLIDHIETTDGNKEELVMMLWKRLDGLSSDLDLNHPLLAWGVYSNEELKEELMKSFIERYPDYRYMRSVVLFPRVY